MSLRQRYAVTLLCLVALVASCGRAAPTSTPVSPSETPAPTPLLPTETPEPPTLVPASPTPLPPSPTPPPAAPSAGRGRIVFVSARDGNGEIYSMNADGSDQRRLTNHPLWDGYPDWSPDGTQIAYYSYLSDENWVIQVMDADGSHPRQVTDNNRCDGAPYWSPDGTRIAYTAALDCRAQQREVYVVNLDGSGDTNLTQHDADDGGSSWSPDGTLIAFSSDRDGNAEVYVMSSDGSNVRRLTDEPADDRAPAWSPDGTQIAFWSERDGNAEIYVMSADGSDPRRLTDNPGEDWFPRWSPDGRQLTFSSKRGGNLDIYVLDVADALASAGRGTVRRLTDSPREDFNSVWQPAPPAAPAVSWARRFPGDPRWSAQDGLVTGDGGLLLVGATNYSHQNSAREDLILVRTDAAGEQLWSRTYGGDAFDRGEAVVEAGGAGYLVLGETASTGAGGWDIYLLRVDGEGNEVWSRTFGGPGMERARAIRPAAGGGAILIGQTASAGAGGADVYLVRTDDQGAEIWSRTYGGEKDEEGSDIRQTPDGGFLVLAQVLQVEAVYVDQKPDILLIRTDAEGEVVWSHVWETEEADGGHVLLPSSGGGYLIAGITAPAGDQSAVDLLLARIDDLGNRLWKRTLGDPGAVDYATDAVELPSGGFLLTGMVSLGGRGAIPLTRITADGRQLWSASLAEGRGNKAAMTLLPTPDGGYLIVGTTDEYGRGFETVLIRIEGDESPAGTGTMPRSPSLGDTWTRTAERSTMVYVHGGGFRMGSTDDDVNAALEMCQAYYTTPCERAWFEVELPAHDVVLGSYWLDRTEVTNAQYERCVTAGACTPPRESGSDTRPAYFGEDLFDDHPVAHVTWNQADAYCRWAGGRLPTEAEWEYAARGPEGRRYPWGAEYDGSRLNSCDSRCAYEWAEKAHDDGYGDTAPVGSYPGGASWCGALDLAGNVWEWTADWFGSYTDAPQSNPSGPATGTGRAVRGDAADGTRAVSRAAARHGMAPGRTYAYTGFRCVVLVQEPD